MRIGNGSQRRGIGLSDDLLDGPLTIDHVSTPAGGKIGMVHCPGRNHVDSKGHVWTRNLAVDLEMIKSWPATMLVSLVQETEFETLGVAGLGDTALALGLLWYHLPIKDMHPPDENFERDWTHTSNEVSRLLIQRHNIVLHCAGGLGRTGTVAARILIEHGSSVTDSVQAVRTARPGAIETTSQENYLARIQPAIRQA